MPGGVLSILIEVVPRVNLSQTAAHRADVPRPGGSRHSEPQHTARADRKAIAVSRSEPFPCVWRGPRFLPPERSPKAKVGVADACPDQPLQEVGRVRPLLPRCQPRPVQRGRRRSGPVGRTTHPPASFQWHEPGTNRATTEGESFTGRKPIAFEPFASQSATAWA